VDSRPTPVIWETLPVNEETAHLHLPEGLRSTVFVDSIHGGDVIPERFAASLGQQADGDLLRCEIMQRSYCTEKDWGADQVARMLTDKLGLDGFCRVRIARCLMDFGRFPGVTTPGASHLSRFAINDPSARFLAHDQKRDLLANCFDPISSFVEELIPNRRLKIAVHTYDKLNDTGTERPLVSLIYRSQAYQRHTRMPLGIFDRLYPDHLGEFSVDRRLVARISLELDKQGVTVAYNHPYALPEGSVEVRSQVWFFFAFVRKRFLAMYPECHGDPHLEAVWKMLRDTNLRDAEAGMLRGYLHLFRTVSEDQMPFYRRCRQAYERLGRFIEEHQLANAYRQHPERASSLAIEVRKDFVWQFRDSACRDPVLGPGGARHTNIDIITTELARAIGIYFDQDRAPDPGTIPEGRPPRAR
jgi:hypothetical protein